MYIYIYIKINEQSVLMRIKSSFKEENTQAQYSVLF